MKFYHHINENNKGGFTIAYESIKTDKGENLIMAFAQCSKKDYYCKRTGRDIALNKYITGKVTSIVVKGSVHTIKNIINKFYLNKLQAD